MNYLLDKKNKKRKYRNISLGVVILLLFIFFGASIFNTSASFSNTVFKPVITLGNNIRDNFNNMNFYFQSKKALTKENENLKIELENQSLKILELEYLEEENIRLKSILDKIPKSGDFVLSTIISKPNQSLYDTLVIDKGRDEEVSVGDLVFANGNIPIGKISEVFDTSSKVTLFSTSREKTDVVIGSTGLYMQAIGRGGGNFEIILPRDFVLEKGTKITIPSMDYALLGQVATIVSDPRDSYQKALVVSPINIQQLKFVQVRK